MLAASRRVVSMETQSRGSGRRLGRFAMANRSISKLARPDVKQSPRRGLIKAIEAELSEERSRAYADRLAAALPICIEAPPHDPLWRSALVGPARYPDGYAAAKGTCEPASQDIAGRCCHPKACRYSCSAWSFEKTSAGSRRASAKISSPDSQRRSASCVSSARTKPAVSS
jgi:hypothetical protein